MSQPDDTPPLSLEEWVARQQQRRDAALAKLDTAVTKLGAIETRLQAGGATWDNATAAQRTMVIRDLVSVVGDLGVIVRRLCIEQLDAS